MSGINDFESGSSPEETETDDELPDPAGQREPTGKDTVSEKKERKKRTRVCEDSRGSPFWKGLVLGLRLVALIVLESTLGGPFMTVSAIGLEERNCLRDRVLRENAASGDTTAADKGPAARDHHDGRARTRKKKKHKEEKVQTCNIL